MDVRVRQKIAIVGSGISGLVCAHLLNDDHEITVFEANGYAGGHTHTLEVPVADKVYSVDTGFIVFTESKYPHFAKLLTRLGVASQPSEMSFSVRDAATGLEYNGTSLNKLFAQRRNLLRPAFYRMLTDILRFYREAPELLAGEDDTLTLGAYLADNRYSREFVHYHILPMGAAIWSASPDDMLDFPAQYFVRFFHHHGFLQRKDRPAWRTVVGGSHQYVKALIAPMADRLRLNSPVRGIRRFAQGVEVQTEMGKAQFDQVILAVHSDQALRLLADPSQSEREILGAIHYKENPTILHTDASVLPKNKRAWASWNYFLPAKSAARATVTYNMNMLQNLDAPVTFCTTLNRDEEIHPDKIIQKMTYHHPQFTPGTIQAQKRHHEINGMNRTYYCGAYWGFGFHEDGVRSGLAVAEKFGKSL
ncbi:MAG: FAD-dependent oxidoreductase [bacterium]|nr:FAD-dependent oxidoreductase [bacterium]